MSDVEVICFEDAAFYALVEQVVQRVKEQNCIRALLLPAKKQDTISMGGYNDRLKKIIKQELGRMSHS